MHKSNPLFQNKAVGLFLISQVSYPLFTGFKTIISSIKTKENPWSYYIFKLPHIKCKTFLHQQQMLQDA